MTNIQSPCDGEMCHLHFGISGTLYLSAMLTDLVISGNIYIDKETFCFHSNPDARAALFPTTMFGEFLVISEITIGLGLYFLVNKSCCTFSTTKVQAVIALAASWNKYHSMHVFTILDI